MSLKWFYNLYLLSNILKLINSVSYISSIKRFVKYEWKKSRCEGGRWPCRLSSIIILETGHNEHFVTRFQSWQIKNDGLCRAEQTRFPKPPSKFTATCNSFRASPFTGWKGEVHPFMWYRPKHGSMVMRS